MQDKLLNIKILSPNGSIFDGEATYIVFPGTQAPFAVYPKHAPIISSLSAGRVRYSVRGGEEKVIEIKSGFVEVGDDNVIACVEL